MPRGRKPGSTNTESDDSWDAIARECGFNSRQAAQHAAQSAMRKVRKELERRGIDLGDISTRESPWDRLERG